MARQKKKGAAEAAPSVFEDVEVPERPEALVEPGEDGERIKGSRKKEPRVQGVFVLRGAGSYATAAFPGFYAVRNRPFPVMDPALAEHLRASSLFEERR